MNIEEVPTRTLLWTLSARLWQALCCPFKRVRSWCTGTGAPTVVPEPTATDAPCPPTDTKPSEVPTKNTLCLKLESIAEELKVCLPTVQAAPGVVPLQFATVLYREGEIIEKWRRACGVFSSFGTNKDFLAWAFGAKEASKFTLFALQYPNWIKLARVGEFKDNTVFRAEDPEGEVYYLVSNRPYSANFATEESEEQERQRRLQERDNLMGPIRENAPRANNA